MNKKLTKVLSVFLIAGVIGAGAVGAAGCHKHTYDKDTWVVSPDDDTKHGNPSNCKHEGLIDAKSLEDHVDADNNGKCDKCGEDIPGYTPPAGATVTAVTVSAQNNATSVAVGGNLQLSATVTGTGNPAQTVTWSTTSDKIELSDSGLVTGKTATADGEKVTIKATSTADPTKYGEIQLTVTASTPQQPPVTAKVTSVTVTAAGNATSVMEKDWLQLTATVAGEGDYSSEVTWTSSDDAKATVDANGKVTGVAACDEVTITATSKADDTKYGSVTLSVTAYVDEHAGTKYAEIRDKSNNIIAEDFKHTTKADITVHQSYGTPGVYVDSNGVYDVTGGKLVAGGSSSSSNISAVIDFGLVDGVVEGYFEFTMNDESNSGNFNNLSFVDSNGSTVLQMMAVKGGNFAYTYMGQSIPAENSVQSKKDQLYKVYFKLDLDEGKITLDINGTKAFNESPCPIDDIAGLKITTSNGGKRSNTIDNIAVAADQMTAAKLKTKLLEKLEDEYETYDRTNDYTKNGALIHAAYQAAVTAINAEGATIDDIRAAYKTAVDAMADVLSDEDLWTEGFGGYSERVGTVLGGIFSEYLENVSIDDVIVIDGNTIKGNAIRVFEIIDLQALTEALTYEVTGPFTGKIRTMSDLKAWADKAAEELADAAIPTDAEIIDEVKDAVNAHIDKLIDAAKAEHTDIADDLEALRTSLKGQVTGEVDAYDENDYGSAGNVVAALQDIDDGIAGAIQQVIDDASTPLETLQTQYKGDLDSYAAEILAEEAQMIGEQSAPQGLVTAVNAKRDEWKQTIDAVTEEHKGTISTIAQNGKTAMLAALNEYKNSYFEITVKISSSCNIAVDKSTKTYATISKKYGDQLGVWDIRINGFYVTEATAGSVTLTQGGIDTDPTHVKIYGNLEITVTKMEDSGYVKEEKWKVTGEEDSYTQNDKLVISYGNSLFSFTSMLGATFKDLSVTIDGETFTHSVASTSITKDTNNAETPYSIYASATLKTLTIYNTLTESGGEKDNRCGTIYYSINDGAPVVVKTLSSNGNMKNACVIQNVPAGANIKLWAENTSGSGGATLHIYGIYATIDEDSVPETVHVTWEGDQQDYWYRHGDEITAPALPQSTPTQNYTHWEFTCHEEEGHYHGQMWSDGMQLGSGEHNLVAKFETVVAANSIEISDVGDETDGLEIVIGSSLQLKAVVKDAEDGVLPDRTVTWNLGGYQYAEISSDCVLTLKTGAQANDTITIKATIGSVESNSLTITVKAPEVNEESYMYDDIEADYDEGDGITGYESGDTILDYTLFTLKAATKLTVLNEGKNATSWKNNGEGIGYSPYGLQTDTIAAKTGDKGTDLVTITANENITVTLYVLAADNGNFGNKRVFTVYKGSFNTELEDMESLGATDGDNSRNIVPVTFDLDASTTPVTISIATTANNNDNFVFHLYGIEVEKKSQS